MITAIASPSFSALTSQTSMSTSTQAGRSTMSGVKELSAEEQAQVRKLEARDRAVRNHEAAHLAAAGGLARSGASYTYETGPDGRQYAVGGDVSIDTSPGRTPAETISRAQQIRSAALAPSDPSSQDYRVAAEAAKMLQDAQASLAEEARAKATPQASAAASPAISAYEAVANSNPETTAGRLISTAA